MKKTATPVALADLSLAELVTVHNLTVPAGRATRKFSDRASAVRRTQAALDFAEFDAVREADGSVCVARRAVVPEATRQRTLDEQAEARAAVAPEGTSDASGADQARDRAPPASVDDPAPTSKGRDVRKGRASYADDVKITVVSSENPRRGKAAERFACYASSPTIGDYVAAMAKMGHDRDWAVRDVAWDARHGFIRLG